MSPRDGTRLLTSGTFERREGFAAAKHPRGLRPQPPAPSEPPPRDAAGPPCRPSPPPRRPRRRRRSETLVDVSPHVVDPDALPPRAKTMKSKLFAVLGLAGFCVSCGGGDDDLTRSEGNFLCDAS